MKYSIIMPYYRRATQLHNTFVSFEHHYADRHDYEIVLVIDKKNDDEVNDVLIAWRGCLPVTSILCQVDGYSNPSPMFNLGVRNSTGEYIVLTNPECLHQNNVLAGLDQEFEQDQGLYVMCACQSLVKCAGRVDRFDDLKGQFHMWYQHSQHNNRCLHFCSALSRLNYNLIEGFDEAYAHGIAYDDDDFREKIKAAKIEIVLADTLLVSHQEHTRQHQILQRGDYKQRLNRNQKLYYSKWGEPA